MGVGRLSRVPRSEEVHAVRAQTTAETAARKAMDYGLMEVNVFVKGPGGGGESAVRSLGALGLRVRTIRNVTPIPHNGCRPQKKRRV